MKAKIMTQDGGRIVVLEIPATGEIFATGVSDENIVDNVFTHEKLWEIFGRLKDAPDKESWRAGRRKIDGVTKHLPGIGFCARGTIEITPEDLAFLRRLRDFVQDCRRRGIEPTDAMVQNAALVRELLLPPALPEAKARQGKSRMGL